LTEAEVAELAVQVYPEKRVFVTFEADYEAVEFHRFDEVPWTVYVACTRTWNASTVYVYAADETVPT
jgi:hypothetical protein